MEVKKIKIENDSSEGRNPKEMVCRGISRLNLSLINPDGSFLVKMSVVTLFSAGMYNNPFVPSANTRG